MDDAEKETVTASDVGSLDQVVAASKFTLGQEVKLPDGKVGKVIEVRGTAEAGFSYAVAHGVLSEFTETDLGSV